MTERQAKAARVKRRTTGTVYAAGLALFALVTGALAAQMAGGEDPALGAGSSPPRHAMVRKVVITRRITTIRAAAPAPPTQAAPVPALTQVAAPAQQPAPAPQPAPAQQPAPAPQPVQPAPAPASQPVPVQTSTS